MPHTIPYLDFRQVEVCVEKLLLKASEVGQIMNVGRSKVYSLIAQGVIPSVRLGRAIRVRKTALEQWIIDHEKAKGDDPQAGNLRPENEVEAKPGLAVIDRENGVRSDEVASTRRPAGKTAASGKTGSA